MGYEIAATRGVQVHYGPRKTDSSFGGKITQDAKKLARWVFDFDNLPGYGSSNLEQMIPANSTIIGSQLRIIESFVSAGTGRMAIGSVNASTGAVISSNGFVAVGDATSAAIAVKGDIITGTGTLNGGTVGALDVEVRVINDLNPFTAGRGELIIEYMTPAPSAA